MSMANAKGIVPGGKIDLPPLPAWEFVLAGIIFIVSLGFGAYGVWSARLADLSSFTLPRFSSSTALELEASQAQVGILEGELASISAELASVSAALEALENEDQVVKNKTLQEEVRQVRLTYQQAITEYENLLDLKEGPGKTDAADKLFTRALLELSRTNYASATATLRTLRQTIDAEKAKVAAAGPAIPANVPSNNTAPDNGYRRQKVETDQGSFLVDIVAADLNSTKVVIDTASDGTCTNDCPVMSVSAYAGRSGAFAAINGSYFCPASYPSCAGKTNSFDTLLMNKNKTYFNSDNNVYSSVPAAIFSAGSARFVSKSQEWGRDTGVDGVIANQPLMVHNGNLLFGGGDDPKQSSRGNRSFVGSSGSKAYIGVVHNASVAQAAKVLHTMGLQNALNLDSGGSTALWSGGYKVGPGRDVPNAILFVRR